MNKLIPVIIATLLLSSCLSAPSPSARPKWVDDKYSAYPEKDYMVEIGQGSSLKNAKSDGAASLAQIFKTNIKAETTVETRYKELSTGGNVQASKETNFNENITQLAEQELINVNYGESWTDNLGQVYVIAYIDRKETAQIYRRRIMENSDSVNKFISQSGEQSSPIEKFAFLDAAYVVAEANGVLINQLEIINPAMSHTVMLGYDMDSIRGSRRTAAKSMVFRLNIVGDDEGKVTAALSDELTSGGFSVDPSGTLSIQGSVSFEKVNLDNGYENLKYYLTVNMTDVNGVPVVSLEKNSRVSALSASDAKNRAYVEIGKAIKKDFLKKWTDYLDGFVR